MKRTEPPSPNVSNLTATTEDTAMSSLSATSPETEGHPGLTPAVQKHIGNLLKVSFQDLLTEPVPDRFASLLEQLEQAEKKGK